MSGIGIESEHEFPSITGATLNIGKVQEHSRFSSSMKIEKKVQEQLRFQSSDNKVPEQLRFQSSMTGDLMLHEKSIEVPNELMHKPDHDQSLELLSSSLVAIGKEQSNSNSNYNTHTTSKANTTKQSLER